jgi:hypothetical protein
METSLDIWIQRATAMAMVGLALALIGVGVRLYAPPSHPASAPVARAR